MVTHSKTNFEIGVKPTLQTISEDAFEKLYFFRGHLSFFSLHCHTSCIIDKTRKQNGSEQLLPASLILCLKLFVNYISG